MSVSDALAASKSSREKRKLLRFLNEHARCQAYREVAALECDAAQLANLDAEIAKHTGTLMAALTADQIVALLCGEDAKSDGAEKGDGDV